MAKTTTAPTVDLLTFRRELTLVLEAVEEQGASFTLTRYGNPVATLSPTPPSPKREVEQVIETAQKSRAQIRQDRIDALLHGVNTKSKA